MKTVVNHLPPSSHAVLTDELKTGCYKVHDAMTRHKLDDVRSLDLKSTADMDGQLLQTCVSFLTYEKVNFKTLVAKHRSQAKLRDIFSTRRHHNLALMDLRQIIAEQDSLPWREDHLHYWQHMHTLHESLDAHDQAQTDGFFKLLCNTSLTDLAKNHISKVLSSEVDVRMFGDQAPYVASKYLDSLIRVDAAESLFSVVVGDRQSIKPQPVYFDEFCTYPVSWAGSDSDYTASIKKYATSNPGVRFSTLDEALISTMRRKEDPGYKRQVDIYCMGERIVSAQLGHNSFSLISVYVPETKGLNLHKTMVLDMVQDAESVMGFTQSMGDLLMADLGL